MKPESRRLSSSRWRLLCLIAAMLVLPEAFPEMRFVDMSFADTSATPVALIGSWRAESIRRRGVIGNVQTVIAIAADGRVTGNGGCNLISGGMTVNEARISFSQMVATEMACAPAIMDQESNFLSALGDARLWRIDEQRDRLILVDAHGVTVLRLLRM